MTQDSRALLAEARALVAEADRADDPYGFAAAVEPLLPVLCDALEAALKERDEAMAAARAVLDGRHAIDDSCGQGRAVPPCYAVHANLLGDLKRVLARHPQQAKEAP